MRPAYLALIALILAAPPTVTRAAEDDAAIQALIGKLKPRPANERIVVRGLPASGRTPDATVAEPAAPAPVAAPRQNTTAVAAIPTATAASPAAADQPSADLNVQFATGSAILTPSAESQLHILGKALTSPLMANSHFRVEGHTDTVGDPMVNKVLSERRAQAVADFLTTRFPINRDRLETVGKGAEDLLVQTPAQTPEIKNRRVHVVNLNG